MQTDTVPPSGSGDTLLGHLEALRGTLLRVLAATALLYPVGYALAPTVMRLLVRLCLPPDMGPLHYFAPMEVFWTKLRLAFVIAIALAHPWNMLQLWGFLVPALHPGERVALRRWVLASTLLFALGAAFCAGLILPLVMRFAAGFATDGLRPVLGLSHFLGLAGWLVLAFGAMFQAPLLALGAVRLGLVSPETLAHARPYVIVGILLLAAILTPPDVVSQLLLAVPSWLLFEGGLALARATTPRE